MSLTTLLVVVTGRNKKVKRRLKGALRLVREGHPAIPARAAKRAGRVIETIEDSRKGLIWRRLVGLRVHLVRIRIVEF